MPVRRSERLAKLLYISYGQDREENEEGLGDIASDGNSSGGEEDAELNGDPE